MFAVHLRPPPLAGIDRLSFASEDAHPLRLESDFRTRSRQGLTIADVAASGRVVRRRNHQHRADSHGYAAPDTVRSCAARTSGAPQTRAHRIVLVEPSDLLQRRSALRPRSRRSMANDLPLPRQIDTSRCEQKQWGTGRGNITVARRFFRSTSDPTIADARGDKLTHMPRPPPLHRACILGKPQETVASPWVYPLREIRNH